MLYDYESGDTLEIAALALKVEMSEVLDDTEDSPEPPNAAENGKTTESHE